MTAPAKGWCVFVTVCCDTEAKAAQAAESLTRVSTGLAFNLGQRVTISVSPDEDLDDDGSGCP